MGEWVAIYHYACEHNLTAAEVRAAVEALIAAKMKGLQ